MNDNLERRDNQLLVLVWNFHSALNTAWPKPNTPQMAGASVFIGTNLFKALEDGLGQIQRAIDGFQGGEGREELFAFWTAFSGLFQKIEAQDRSERSEPIDQAINLLYLASGVFYHRITETASVVPHFDNRLVGVEDLDRLFELCNWANPGKTVKAALDGLVQQMNATANQFK